MRSLLLPLALLAALVVGAACGPDAEPELDGVRVRLLVDPIDAPLEGRFFIRAMQFGAPEDIPTFPLEPVPGDAGLYIARGAPAGVYGVRSESDWGMLWFAQNPPFLSDDPTQPPTQVQMGRGQTIYLRPTEYPREEGQGGVWRVEQVAPGREGAPREITVEEQSVASFVALRIPEGEYEGHLRVTGQYVSGTLIKPHTVKLKEGVRTPRVVFTRAAVRMPFVLDVATQAGGARPQRVDMQVLDLPFVAGERIPLAEDGPTRIDAGVPDLGTSVAFRLGDHTYPMVGGRWQETRNILLAVLPEGETLSVTPSDKETERVLVRWSGAAEVARLPHAGDGAQAWKTVKQAQTLWFLGASTWAIETRDATGAVVGERRTGRYGEARLRIQPSAESILLVLERIEDDVRVAVDGLRIPVLPGTPVRVPLVPGVYEAHAVGITTGRRGTPKRFEIGPGTTVIRTIDAP